MHIESLMSEQKLSSETKQMEEGKKIWELLEKIIDVIFLLSMQDLDLIWHDENIYKDDINHRNFQVAWVVCH